MANNAYYSRLKVACKEHGKEKEFENGYNKLSKGGVKPTTEQIKTLLEKLGVPFPQIGPKKLTEEEKKAKAEQNKKVLLDIYENGTANEKKKLQEIINNHQKELNKEAELKTIKAALTKLRRIKGEKNTSYISDGEILKELGFDSVIVKRTAKKDATVKTNKTDLEIATEAAE